MGLFWQGWWSARSVVVVEVNGYGFSRPNRTL